MGYNSGSVTANISGNVTTSGISTPSTTQAIINECINLTSNGQTIYTCPAGKVARIYTISNMNNASPVYIKDSVGAFNRISIPITNTICSFIPLITLAAGETIKTTGTGGYISIIGILSDT